MQAVADLIPGATVVHGVVLMDGVGVVFAREPFSPSTASLHGWRGAVVFSPRCKDSLTETQFEAVLRLARDAHERAGISA
jgi:hypothetical protein